MNWFRQYFTRRGKIDAALKRALEKSKADLPAAIGEYTSVITTKDVPPDLKAMALFNRGLAYSQTAQLDLGVNDFQDVLKMANAPRSVVSAARERLERLRRRDERDHPAKESTEE